MVTFSPAQVCVKIGTAGKSKTSLPELNMLVRAFLAGAYVAMGATLATVSSTDAAAYFGSGISQLIVGAVFPVGLMLVVFTGLSFLPAMRIFFQLPMAYPVIV